MTEALLRRRLHGKVALVTAAAQGIGRAIAELFEQEGAIVWATDVNETLLSGVACRCRMQLDVCDAKAIEHAPKRTGALDILVNCAAHIRMRAERSEHAKGIFIRIASREANQVHLTVVRAINGLTCDMMSALDQINHRNDITYTFASILSQIAICNDHLLLPDWRVWLGM